VKLKENITYVKIFTAILLARNDDVVLCMQL